MGVGSGTGVYGAWKSSYRSTSGSMGSACQAVNPHAGTQIKMTKIKTQREMGVAWWVRQWSRHGMQGGTDGRK